MAIPGSILNNLIPDPTGMSALVAKEFPSVCTILHRTVALDAAGQDTHSFSAWDTRHTNIPCRKSPTIQVRPQSQEAGTGNFPQLQSSHWTLNILGDFSDILDVDQAQVDGLTYEILAVEPDGNKLITRLLLGRIVPFNA